MASQNLFEVQFALGEKDIRLCRVQVESKFLGEHIVDEALYIVVDTEVKSTGLWCLALSLKKDRN